MLDSRSSSVAWPYLGTTRQMVMASIHERIAITGWRSRRIRARPRSRSRRRSCGGCPMSRGIDRVPTWTAQTCGNTCTQLIALSVLELGLPAPGEGWPAYLADRGISITIDDIGWAAISRTDARRREAEARAREHTAVVERQAIEQDRQRLALIYKGVPADAVPIGVHPSTAMLQAAHDAGPRRASMVEEAFSNSGETTFHPMPDGDEW